MSGIKKKKQLGQHFLHKQSVVDNMIAAVQVDSSTTVMEIGCGDGFLTQSILAQTPCKELACFEIDCDWIGVVKSKIKDPRLKIKHRDILELDWKKALSCKLPLVLLANLPYQITFPILFQLKDHKTFFSEGVVMVQEEVAQKLVASRGRNFNHVSMMLQHHFEFKLLEKIEPAAFNPPPKVFSRTVYFKPKNEALPVEDEQALWKFTKLCFHHPRQTMKNNLLKSGFTQEQVTAIDTQTLAARAQQLELKDFINLYQKLG